MDALIIKGPARLQGRVDISGSKNTALPLLFSSILFDKELHFENVPRLWDIETTLKILEAMGCQWEWNKEKGAVWIYPKIDQSFAPYEWVKRMRASILALGPLLARTGEARVSLPGGCSIGARPVNFHIEAMKKMGVSIEVAGGYIEAKVSGLLRGVNIHFPDITVTGTENLLMLACAAEGETVFENAACEPEVVALGNFLIECGADISGLGTPTVRVKGPTRWLAPSKVSVPPDRIETGTWIAAAAATMSELTLCKTDSSKLTATLEAFSSLGVRLHISNDEITVIPSDRYEPLSVETEAYPGFPTDMQAQFLVNLCLAIGVSRMKENIFENRFMHVAELRRLGAQIHIEDSTAIVRGPTRFIAAPMMATDLRASASLVIAALCAHGESKISRIYHLDRGYQRLDEKLKSLGAEIHRINE